jgi:hypothetical protein
MKRVLIAEDDALIAELLEEVIGGWWLRSLWRGGNFR